MNENQKEQCLVNMVGGVSYPSQAATIFDGSPKEHEVWPYPDGNHGFPLCQFRTSFS